MNRVQQLLIALLVIQVILAGAVYMPRNTANQSGPLLSDYKADAIVKMEIVDADKNEAQLVKDGAEWKLAVPDGSLYPTEANKVQGVLDKLTAATNNRMITRTATSHKQLKVAGDDFVRKISLSNGAGVQYILYIGTSPGTGTSHVRLDGKDEVYLAALDSYDFDATPSGWINTAFLSFPDNSVTSITLKNNNGTFEFSRDASNKWSMKDWGDSPFDTDKFAPLASRLTNMRMLRPFGVKDDPAYKMDNPLAIVTFTYKKSESESPTVTLTIGARDEKSKSYVVKSSTSEYYMKVDGYYIDEYVNSKKDDFIKAEPTPTAPANPPAAQ